VDFFAALIMVSEAIMIMGMWSGIDHLNETFYINLNRGRGIWKTFYILLTPAIEPKMKSKLKRRILKVLCVSFDYCPISTIF